MSEETAQNLKDVVDELARVRLQKTELEAREERLRNLIKDANQRTTLGARFQAVRVEQNRLNVDWKAVALKLNPSRQLLRAHSSKDLVVSIRTSLRKDVALREALGK